MKAKISLPFLLIALFLVLGSAGPAFACWCRGISSCEATNRSDTIFVGKVVSIAGDDQNERSFLKRESVVFKVGGMLAGKRKKNVKIVTGAGDRGGSDCDYYGFKENETYLVYAHRSGDAGELRVGLCGGTKLLAKADEDLMYLRAVKKDGPGSTVSGYVSGVVFDAALNGYSGAFLPRIPIQLYGNGITRTFYTNNFGDYEITGLRAGTYRLQVFMPAYYDFTKYGDLDLPVREVKLNGRGCSLEYFSPEINNTLEGRITGPDGKPLENIEVSLAPAVKREADDADDTYTTETGKDGTYKFSYVFPRGYYLGINIREQEDDEDAVEKLFYPNSVEPSDAAIIEFGLGQHLNGFDMVLPSL